MIKFSELLMEDKGGKNLHLEHLEDEIINYGVDGGRAAINFLQSLRDMLAGSSRSSVNMTVKWDGAPAIFAGVDPSDGKFFVAKKSVFNVSPKLYKTNKEIDDDLSGNLNSKFKVALAEFSKLGIKGVLQGDLMFTDDIEKTKIEGVVYYTFQPNTIVYAVPVDSDLGKVMNRAKIGVVWHTTYTGKELQDMKASFGVNISGLNKPSSVWMDDATYKDVSGRATFTEKEKDAVTKILSQTGSTFQRINAPLLKKFINLQESLKGVLAGASLKTYNNSKVRVGEIIKNPKQHAQGYLKWVEMSIQKQIDKVKSDKGKEKYMKIQKEYLREFGKHTNNLTNILTFQNLLVDAKMQIIKKLNSVKGLTDTFIKTDNGFKVTNPEGYVAIDRVSGGAVKLVDRMEFLFQQLYCNKGMGQMKTYKELQDDIEFEKTLDDLVEFKLISKAQRRKIALRMKRLVKTAAFKKKVERSKKKIANFAKQKVKAAKLAKQKVLDKFYPKYKEMSLAARVKIDQILQQKHGGLINKLTQKLGKVVKKKEIEKVRKAREVKQDDK